MPDTVISVENLGKQYRLRHLTSGGYRTFREMIAEKFARLLHPAPKLADEEFWALKDVSFSVQQGEVVGIIGRNGAGKSTLLKVLSRITQPTTGRVRIQGRVASLLEVGTGFHPELSGRENIFLNGAILGMGRDEIRAKFDEIVAFAEVEKFLDTPVKRYSSGMYLRLAFAVAAHLDPEILIVDEVLAVGDAAFQRKCLGRMAEVARGGRTVLFVSHNMSAISQFCPKCIWLNGGRVQAIGSTPSIIESYLLHWSEEQLGGERAFKEDPAKPGQVLRLRLLNHRGEVTDKFVCEHPIQIEMTFLVRREEQGMYCWADLTRTDGLLVWMSDSHDTGNNPLDALRPGTYRIILTVPRYSIGHGDYVLTLNFTGFQGGAMPVDNLSSVCAFRVDDYLTKRGNQRLGSVCAPGHWQVFTENAPPVIGSSSRCEGEPSKLPSPIST